MAKKTTTTELTGRRLEVANLLRRKNGATTAQIKERTGMQEHSARALISRLGIPVTKTKNGAGATVYSIVESKQEAA